MNGPAARAMLRPVPVCSTPFGITDEWTHADQKTIGFRNECSTPFGITDEWTFKRQWEKNLKIAVLNAFRHHG
ncbi:hypothetical protein SAMN05421783_10812 [Thiocapsa roseopersicina]|uniref:Uncharacterized protein n=1 Tax=Thiocapsa roseopersicina TaxID=1058 RepID=A0A1H2W217_THIRO|nr:hypothetical protein SAMN05421783_10812 [Thiocapsa roseopersicina]